jgi:hypothetical protein
MTTFSITTHSLKGLFAILIIKTFNIAVSSTVLLNFFLFGVVMRSVAFFIHMLSVIMMNVIVLSVVALQKCLSLVSLNNIVKCL